MKRASPSAPPSDLKPRRPQKAKAPALSRSSAPGQSPAPAVAVLAAQGWAEADEALAQALIAQTRVATAVAALRRKLQRGKDAPLAAAADALDGEALAVEQGLRRAAKARGLVLIGDPGAAEAFDPKRHRLVRGEARKGVMVKIVSPGVVLGRTVIALAEARPMRAKPPEPAPEPAKAPPRAPPKATATSPKAAPKPLRGKKRTPAKKSPRKKSG